MAFGRTLTKDVGTSLTEVREAVGASSDVVIGMRITNITAADIKVSACITAGGINYNLIGDVADNAGSGMTVPPGDSLIVINGDADKVVMVPNDTLQVISSVASSADVIVSALEE